MKRFVIDVLVLGVTSAVSAAFLPVPLTYSSPITPGTHIITNDGTLEGGRPEVVAVGRVDERTNLARSPRGRSLSSLRVDDDAPTASTPSLAPLGVDGRVVDTAEVAAAKAAHAAAHANERLKFAREAARSSASESSPEIADGAIDAGTPPETTIGPDGRILDADPEVAAAHVNEKKINLAREIATNNDVLAHLADGAVVPLVLVGVDGRSLEAPQVAADGNGSPLNNVKSVDALAVAGPALAYGRLFY